MNLYSCDVPRCNQTKEVITPAGYLCRSCANELGQEVREQWEY